jgi:hypothetical protein
LTALAFKGTHELMRVLYTLALFTASFFTIVYALFMHCLCIVYALVIISIPLRTSMTSPSKKHTKRHSKKENSSDETKEEALSVARGIQKPGQNKDQTKLVAQGIQKGIELYKKQHKAKSRELDKQLKKAKNYKEELLDSAQDVIETKPSKNWLPWALLGLSWVAFVAYEFYGKSVIR